MPRRKLPMRLIEDRRRRKQKFATSLACVKKKAEELSKLCDTDVAVLVVGPDGEVETWPEEASKLYAVLGKFQKFPKEVRSKHEHGLPWLLAERDVGEHQNQQRQSQRAVAGEKQPDVDLPPPAKEDMIVVNPLQAMNHGSILDIQNGFLDFDRPVNSLASMLDDPMFLRDCKAPARFANWAGAVQTRPPPTPSYGDSHYLQAALQTLLSNGDSTQLHLC